MSLSCWQSRASRGFVNTRLVSTLKIPPLLDSFCVTPNITNLPPPALEERPADETGKLHTSDGAKQGREGATGYVASR